MPPLSLYPAWVLYVGPLCPGLVLNPAPRLCLSRIVGWLHLVAPEDNETARNRVAAFSYSISNPGYLITTTMAALSLEQTALAAPGWLAPAVNWIKIGLHAVAYSSCFVRFSPMAPLHLHSS